MIIIENVLLCVSKWLLLNRNCYFKPYNDERPSLRLGVVAIEKGALIKVAIYFY